MLRHHLLLKQKTWGIVSLLLFLFYCSMKMFCSYFRMRAKFSTPRREIFCFHTVLMKKHNRRSRTYNYQIRRRRGNFIRRKKQCALDGIGMRGRTNSVLSVHRNYIQGVILKKIVQQLFYGRLQTCKTKMVRIKATITYFLHDTVPLCLYTVLSTFYECTNTDTIMN